MKKFLLTFFGLALVFSFSPAAAQAALVATYQGNYAVGLGTYVSPLCPTLAVGTAYANRRVLVAIVSGASYFLPTGVTINGSSVGSNYAIYRGSGAPIGSFSGMIVWAWADIPTGTTVSADLVTSASNLNGSGSTVCLAYTFDGTLASSSPTTHSTNAANPATAVSDTISTSGGGFMVSAVRTAYHVTVTNLAITASDETFTSNFNLSEGSGKVGASSVTSGTAARGSSNVTWSWTNNSQALVSSLSWAPAPLRVVRLFEGYRIKLASGRIIIQQQ